MSNIKFDKKDFDDESPLWSAVMAWECEGALSVDKAVQRLIKKYVRRERKRLARVMQPTTITKDELIEILKQEREGKPTAKWPSDFPGKH